MTNAEIIATIRNEIERLKGIGGIVPLDNREQKTGFESALIDIEIFLDTLESEKPMEQEDLNDEIKKYIEEYGYEKGADKLLIAIVARHFAQWGAEHASGSSEIPNDLEEAAKAYALDTAEDSEQYSARYLGYKDGAKWQKEQTEKRWLEDRDGCFWDGVEEGKKAMKEQMLKEAVEGEVYLYHSYKRDATAILVDIPKETLGDKVRIIIVKED